MSEAKTCEFKAEVRKVLQILTNSLYTNKEIFLLRLFAGIRHHSRRKRTAGKCLSGR